MTLYVIIAAIAAVLFGVALAALKMFQSSAKEAGAQGEGRAEAEAANEALQKQADISDEEAAIVMKEPSKDETVNHLRDGTF